MSINCELLDLRAFTAVYDHRSFRIAAELLHLSQPAVSRRIQALESRLGVALFVRSTRHVLPTAAGFKFEAMARRLLEELDTSLLSIGATGEQQSGQLTIAALPSAATHLLPTAIKEFSEKFPLIRLRVLERLAFEGLQCVVSGQAELGINVNLPSEIDITFSLLFEDPYVFVCNRKHPFAKRQWISWQDLSEQRLIGIGRVPDSGNKALLDDILSKAQLQLQWLYEVNSFVTALRLIEDGVGAAIMPRLGASISKNLAVTLVALKPRGLERSIGIIERRRGRLSGPAEYLKQILLAKSQELEPPRHSRSTRAAGLRR
jgi:DNA-binding transcriptional LysR family regulator